MKALILAAGLGTRLRPHTRYLPKPLFTIDDRPLLQRIILQLHEAGCREVMVNTHHLHFQIESFIDTTPFPLPVRTRYEPEILGTGGAIRNLADFWDATPFMVINSDIVTDIDLKRVYDFHNSHSHPVTMVLVDDPRFNTVRIDPNGRVLGFDRGIDVSGVDSVRRLTFTGIQVLDPVILDQIPTRGASSSIDAYSRLLHQGVPVIAYIPEGVRWHDIGTPNRYRRTVSACMAADAFNRICPPEGDRMPGSIRYAALAGDGSDRRWWRLHRGDHHLVMVDHGMRPPQETAAEVDAFIDIGQHLYRQKIAVPRIFAADRLSGLVLLEDLGDVHLQEAVQKCGPREAAALYRKAVDLLIGVWRKGAENFNPHWTWQTATYDKQLVLEKECRYFSRAFLKNFLELDLDDAALTSAFEAVAEAATAAAEVGFMHRDFQSRNLMLHAGRLFSIDFQGGRIGPLQYDLASLLIDPYVALPHALQDDLLEYCLDRLMKEKSVRPDRFRNSYAYCALARNLQILGAFAHLSRTKGKLRFRSYIPRALQTLNRRLQDMQDGALDPLRALVERVVSKGFNEMGR